MLQESELHTITNVDVPSHAIVIIPTTGINFPLTHTKPCIHGVSMNQLIINDTLHW